MPSGREPRRSRKPDQASVSPAPVPNRQIGTEECPRCHGTGKLPVMLCPPECEPICARDLRPYDTFESPFRGPVKNGEPGDYWLCDKHGMVLWRRAERDRCLKELKANLSEGKASRMEPSVLRKPRMESVSEPMRARKPEP